ncbi:DUF2846 domain-containing protein [Lysobacter sp. cf310]|uniref:DUF2846 domain-containing protein n=1 Tax=Lysobacter sp. cf310 TaxID=1761790 RepID=UPI0008EFFA57|nr:DUF2846 domain-containing protein [Lysobacter sp. cf310]SFL32765.1 hypothetical protein SAMN04487938_4184 [Lysobacter sp. cf310]
MNLKFRVSALALGLMFSGAVLAQDAAQPAATEASAEAADDSATDAQASGPIGVPPQGKGQIVFFRPSKLVGAAVGFKVREGETELGKLRNGKYFVHVAEPGTHEYRVHGETKDVLTMEIEAGETYYVQGTLGMGIIAGRPNLSPTDAAAFDALAKKLKLAK